MIVKEFDYNIEDGFAWMIVEGQRNNQEMIVQCCLKEAGYDYKKGEHLGYLKEVDVGNCGEDWGICGDANESAFKYWGQNRCMKMLFKKAEEHGINVIY